MVHIGDTTHVNSFKMLPGTEILGKKKHTLRCKNASKNSITNIPQS